MFVALGCAVAMLVLAVAAWTWSSRSFLHWTKMSYPPPCPYCPPLLDIEYGVLCEASPSTVQSLLGGHAWCQRCGALFSCQLGTWKKPDERAGLHPYRTAGQKFGEILESVSEDLEGS